LLPPKIMDAESACAMWEEANWVILQHSNAFLAVT
jgi:hypothetical protein